MRFFKKLENNKAFLVHCTAGVSRSSAIATLIRYLQNPETAYDILDAKLHDPNTKILDIGRKIFNDPSIMDNAINKVNNKSN